MRKLWQALNRTLLIAGVLVALTPCGLCHSAVPLRAPETQGCCPSSDSQGCHSDSNEPFCQAMDQSSVQAPVAHLDQPVLGVVEAEVSPVAEFDAAPIVFAVSYHDSPPRSSPVLRI